MLFCIGTLIEAYSVYSWYNTKTISIEKASRFVGISPKRGSKLLKQRGIV
jgi:predicted HTH domain antitoxin